MKIRWIYLIVTVPTLTEWFETASLPGTYREVTTDVVLTFLLTGLAWLICRQYDQLSALADKDTLTGLLNARCFHADLQGEIRRAHRQGTPLSLAFLDLDGFKGINDKHGHAEGNRVLHQFARLLSGCVRRHVDRCYRVGGDEFTVILPGLAGADAAEIANRVRLQAREAPTDLARYGAGVSGGIVELLKGEEAPEFQARADVLMYTAKARGKDRIQA